MEHCDNRSVGVIVRNEQDETLLLSRARFPFGWAAPAGHVDSHGSLEQTAIDEVFEETGVRIALDSLEKVIDNVRINNICRRSGGDYHDWTVYEARVEHQQLVQNPEETLAVAWLSRQALAELISKESEGDIERGDNFLEPIWRDFFQAIATR